MLSRNVYPCDKECPFLFDGEVGNCRVCGVREHFTWVSPVCLQSNLRPSKEGGLICLFCWNTEETTYAG